MRGDAPQTDAQCTVHSRRRSWSHARAPRSGGAPFGAGETSQWVHAYLCKRSQIVCQVAEARALSDVARGRRVL